MAKPYLYWDPSYNAELVTPKIAGPLIVNADDLEKFEKFVAISCRPELFGDPGIFYQAILSFLDGTDPERGARVSGYQYMPANLSFYGVEPSYGEPRPFDPSDAYSGETWRYANLGWRLALRGYIGTVDDGGLNETLRVKWGDSNTRGASDLLGAWTGAAVTAFDPVAMKADHLLTELHGKRYSDTNWEYRSGWLDQPISPISTVESAATKNAVDSGEFRIVLSGGPPSWTALWQEYTGSWNDLQNQAMDLRSHATDAQQMALVAHLFAGATKPQPGSPLPPWPTQEAWFREVEVGMFEPWVPDISSVSEREWNEGWRWLTGSTDDYSIELRRPKTDLLHRPMGTANAPVSLREGDDDLGVCIQLGQDTLLSAVGHEDRRYITVYQTEPLVPTDKNLYDKDAPFVCAMRLKLTDMATWGSDRNFISFGDIFAGAPTVSANGIGMYWEDTGGGGGRLHARYFNGAAWTSIYMDFNSADYDATAIDVALAWTGARGGLIGRPDYQLRIVVNGVTQIEALATNLTLAGTERAYVGAIGSQKGLQGLLRAVVLMGEAASDDEILKAFSLAGEPFPNPSFETAQADGRPGEAEGWIWESQQAVGGWAEFNATDEALDPYRRDREDFNAGWENNEDWLDDLEAATTVAAVFNEAAPNYASIYEYFEIWPAGLPWLDSYTLTGAEFTGWHASIDLDAENFDEDWDHDPLTPGSDWKAAQSVDGLLYGAALTFPLTIEPGKQGLVIFDDHSNEAAFLTVPAGEYATASAIQSALNSLIIAQLPAVDIVVNVWTEGGEQGLIFGWDNAPTSQLEVYLGRLQRQPYNDAREALGLVSFGPQGQPTELQYPVSLLPSTPSTMEDDDVMLLDVWSMLEMTADSHSDLGGTFARDYDMAWAGFDTAITVATPVENFKLDGWAGASAVWKASFDPGDLTAALFDSGANDAENFLKANWPDEEWL